MAEYRTKKPGDVLLLTTRVEWAEIGFYVLLDAFSDVVLLCQLEANPETGDVVPTAETVEVPIADLCLFTPTGLSVDVNLDHRTLMGMAMQLGDILEPCIGASLPSGLYQVVCIEGDDVQVSRLHSNEDGRLATTNRLSWIARSERGMYRKLAIEPELRP